MPRRGDVLALAVLGLLHETPLHGYELRKRLAGILGPFRALSYGSLYPALRELQAGGLIAEEEPDQGGVGRRGRIVYRITADGKEHLQDLLAEAGPPAWEDEGFGVRFALFSQTEPATRLRILEGRRNRLEERHSGLRQTLGEMRERVDSYTLALQRHGLESVEREVRWLSELIDSERAAGTPPTAHDTSSTRTDH